MHTAKYPAIRRFLVIDRELRTGSYPTAERLAELTETNDKTIRRDIKFLQVEYEAPIQFNFVHNGWEYTCPTFKLPTAIMTEGELVAVFLAGQALKQVQGTPYEADVQRAIRKITELLPDEVSVHAGTIESAHSFRQTVTTVRDIDTFRRLADAVLHRQQLLIRYWAASREEESERIIDPWHLACVDGDWYLIAYCHHRQARRMFSPSRIRELTATGQTFERPENFSAAEFFDGTFKVVNDSTLPLQTVELRFAPSAAKYIREKVWHLSQQLTMEPDGSALVRLQLRSLVEVRRWVMSWGSECQVLEPAALRDDIRAEAERVLQQPLTTSLPERIPSRTRDERQNRHRTA